SSKLGAAAGKRLIEAVENGSLRIAAPADQLVLLEFLESEGPTPFTLKQIEGQLRSPNKDLRLAAHTLARRFGPRGSSLGNGLWPGILNPKSKFEDTIENLSTVARIQGPADDLNWGAVLLHHEDPCVRMEAVRWWRIFKGRSNVDLLVDNESHLVEKD